MRRPVLVTTIIVASLMAGHSALAIRGEGTPREDTRARADLLAAREGIAAQERAEAKAARERANAEYRAAEQARQAAERRVGELRDQIAKIEKAQGQINKATENVIKETQAQVLAAKGGNGAISLRRQLTVRELDQIYTEVRGVDQERSPAKFYYQTFDGKVKGMAKFIAKTNDWVGHPDGRLLHRPHYGLAPRELSFNCDSLTNADNAIQTFDRAMCERGKKLKSYQTNINAAFAAETLFKDEHTNGGAAKPDEIYKTVLPCSIPSPHDQDSGLAADFAVPGLAHYYDERAQCGG